ncbi:MAG: hypothetical protein MR270_05800, partial [Erysipelotrichaceae bacterium]|nr:hypothetical protein [Erysipelotrichaceae bacterium]
MKKKNLIILLIIPFVISLLGLIAINVTVNIIDADIIAISWNYNDVEGFKVNREYKLEANSIYPNNVTLSEGNNLIWSVKNKDSNEVDSLASINKKESGYYLYALKEGEVIITCSNEKGNIFKTMTGIIYEKGAILLSTLISSSQNNIDSNIYYGEYDSVNKDKKMNIDLSISTIPSGLENSLVVLDKSDNINVSLAERKVTIKDGYNLSFNENAFFKVGYVDESLALPVTFSFIIVKDGINVYSYDDLLACTNKSNNGEIVVLRKSFESLDNFNKISGNNITLFGNYKNGKYSFNNEVYRFKTSYNNEYIDQWNEFASKNALYDKISDEILAGLHIQKDFYGNGYTINFHNLTYPYQVIQVSDENGNIIEIPQLSLDNLFKGPKSFYTLGDPNKTPLISALGQDNCGMYVNGDNITINDVNVKNCDFKNSLSYLKTVGNVVDIYGNNITIKNSRFSSGRNVIRSFSSNDVRIDNCMLSYSQNFLFTTGANEYAKIDDSKLHSFMDGNGNQIENNLTSHLVKNGIGD